MVVSIARNMEFQPAGPVLPEAAKCHSASCCAEFTVHAAGVEIGGTEMRQKIMASEVDARRFLGRVGELALVA